MTSSLLHPLELSARKAEAIRQYPLLWKKVIQEWRAESSRDNAWLIYSANYLLRTGNIRWAVDPLLMHTRLPEAVEVDAARDLQGLSFVLLTHNHADHLDLNLIEDLKDQPILWVIPGFLRARVMERTGLSPSRIVVPEVGKELEISGIRITPFYGAHWEIPPVIKTDEPPLPRKGVHEMGYQVNFNGKRWLFPGDIRTYDRSLLPAFPPLDAVFAHIWLGRKSGLMHFPPLLDDFCRFFSLFDTNRIILTHLDEYHRLPEDLWDQRHAELILERMRLITPHIKIQIAVTDGRIEL